MEISQSDIVRVRQQRWRVANVRHYDGCGLLTLEGLEPANAGVARRVLVPFDIVERVERRSSPRRVSRRLWRRIGRRLLATDTPPGSLRSARTARMDLLPHQLEPALALVRGLGSRVLLADDVGLGKTVQAGLIVAELRALGAADRILIVTPAGLRDQWAHELLTRFGIDARVLDFRTVRRALAALPVGVNPWGSVRVAIASVDFVKRHEVLASARVPRWDVVVVDEAHGVAGDNDRHAAVAALARQASFVVLLTATPHSGDRRTFASLCGIGARIDDELLVFRRSRQDVRLNAARRIHRLHVRMSHDEAHMHAILAQLSRELRDQRGSPPGKDYWLALSVLFKRALSSARSLKHTIDRRLATLAGTDDGCPQQLGLPLADTTGELTVADAPPAWSPLLSLKNGAHERRFLAVLAAAADRAARDETKIRALARLLRRVNEPAIVFTEYRDTLIHLEAALGLPSVQLHGGMPRDERVVSLQRFVRGEARLLLATDAAGEGLNLQHRCRLVINLELPWNPTRLEQRIGRVDRIGQRRAVHIVHLIARDSAESTILSRLQGRIARARADVGGADPLGVDDGATIAALIDGDESLDEPEEERRDPGDGTPRFRMLSLGDEAAVETRRTATARHLLRTSDERATAQAQGLCPVMARARCWQTRRALAGRALLVWLVVAEDGTGQQVGSSVVGLHVDDWRRYDDDVVQQRVDQAADTWRQRVTAVHNAFLSARLARAEGDKVVLAGPLPSQGGLFEQRDARKSLASAAARDAVERDRIERLAEIDRAATVRFRPPELVLVLVP